MNPMHINLSKQRGFTILEILVSIGILVIITAGVATIFNSIGETVSKGRKLSELNQFAARVERIMREDFDAMTRDGFLVIVHKNANYGQDSLLYRGEQTNIDANLYPGFSDGPGRVRRADEIMFFTRGEFETARRAISSGMIASSSEASIYYGLGQKRRPDLQSNFNGVNNFFFNPVPWDSNYDMSGGFNQAALGYKATSGPINPNEFARDWSLLRTVTLLSTPIGESRAVPKDLFGIDENIPALRDKLEDSARQIALQPAQRSIFNSLGWSEESRVNPAPPVPGGPSKLRWLGDDATNQLDLRVNPHYRASGVVDIVSEDLATIRGMIQSLPVKVSPLDYAIFNPNGSFGTNRGKDRVLQNRDQFETDYWITPSDAGTEPDPKDAEELNLAGTALHRDRIRQWMIDALPSRWDMSFIPPVPVAGVRYEDIPTRLMFPETQFPQTDRGDLQRAYAEANQEMLGSSVFVPMCTEFVVEWSYGFVNNSLSAGNFGFKDMIWYGLDRRIDSNNDGILDPTDASAAILYDQRRLGEEGTDPLTNRARTLGMDPLIVVGRPMIGSTNPAHVEIATFGFMDPGGSSNPTNSQEWLWPKFVRITMSLADPSDKLIEQTYQVVFELPTLER